MTTAQMTADELAAGIAALKASIAKSVPSWEQSMIPDGALDQAVADVVTAVDAVRDAADKAETQTPA